MAKASRQGLTKLTTSKERIKEFLINGNVELSSEEVGILCRWEEADRLYAAGQGFEKSVAALTEKFSISRSTAQNDLFTAMEVFATSRRVNKKYILYLKYERQVQDILAFRKKLYNEKGEFTGDHKDALALTKMEESATYTMNSMPADVIKEPFRPVKVRLNLPVHDQIPVTTTIADMLTIGKQFLKNLPLAEVVENGNTGKDN